MDLLRVRHVRPGPGQLRWGIGFLAAGTVVTLLGWPLLKAVRRMLLEESEEPGVRGLSRGAD